ncbi:MAG: right-handed parallel beta-helix repeat-containing protein [Acidobacteriota bacterium]|nr:right-handed parallel beta-helix repeat-containing protein [Acidobacteriota bacterium]
MFNLLLTLIVPLTTGSSASAVSLWAANAGLPGHVQVSARKNTRMANSFPGADLGAKINAADKDLGSMPGEIVVRGSGTISTQVIINSGHTLRFGPGTYTLTTESLWEGAFMLKSRTAVTGSGWDTVIIEPRIGWIVFQSFADGRTQPVHSGTDSNISVTNLQIKGANPAVEGGVRQTVSFGNCHHCAMENVWLNGIGVIGVQAGGNAFTGNYAEHVKFRKNQFTHVASQAAAVVNGRDVVIDGNIFKDSGRCCAQGMTPIDLEPNDSHDIIRNIEITNNLIDSRGSDFLHGNGILVQNGARTLGYGPVLVKGNTVIGGYLVPNTSGAIGTGIYVTAYTENVTVINNTVQRVGHSGIRLENSTRNYVANNTLISTGTGGILSFEIINTTDSKIFDNVVTIDPNSPLGTSVIQEIGTSRNNLYRGNTNGRTALAPNLSH